MDELGTPHDRYFRESFGRLEVARDFLRHNLPTALLPEIDLATLEISKDTYVGEDLSEDCSDLVYRDESVSWNVNIGYTAEGIGEMTILDARKLGIYPVQVEQVVADAA